MIVLDSNVVSEVMRPVADAGVMRWLRRQPIDRLSTTAVTIAEIRCGLALLADGRRRRQLEERLHAFLVRGFGGRVLPFDSVAAEVYADIVVSRRKAGRPIAAFDAMISAIARSHGAAVATRNTGDFVGCGLTVVDPWSED